VSDDYDYRAIALRLNRNQRNLIRQNDENSYHIVGCGERTAQTLCKPNASRPALLQRRKGERWWEYALTKDGVKVEKELAL
jgi:hypothetical protein